MSLMWDVPCSKSSQKHRLTRESRESTRMVARRFALGGLLALSLVAGTGAVAWTVSPVQCSGSHSGAQCCTDSEINCCSWSGDTAGASTI